MTSLKLQTRGRAQARRLPAKESWHLLLYVAGRSHKTLVALHNLRRICDENLQGRYRLEVIDIVENAQLAADEQILAVPMLVRRLPMPIRRIIGDLSQSDRVLAGMNFRPQKGINS